MDSYILKILLYPFSVLYGFIIRIRNLLFDKGVFKSTGFGIPLISVGNITVGGTGKTPLVEYLIRLLKEDHSVAVLSRGYKRRTKDFRIVEVLSDYNTVGDEPLQIKRKFPEILVTVDKDRVSGVNSILSHYPDTDVILLDDAYQHRSIKPGLNILLTDYNRLITNDFLLPAGRLREPRSESRRADIILVTKSPPGLTKNETDKIKTSISPNRDQILLFTGLKYKNPVRLTGEKKDTVITEQLSKERINALLVTGIAQPNNLKSYLKNAGFTIKHLKYPDHYSFSKKDLIKISEVYNNMPEESRCLITTEKDAVRLSEVLSADIFNDDHLYYISIEVNILNDSEKVFNNHILNYAGKNN